MNDNDIKLHALKVARQRLKMLEKEKERTYAFWNLVKYYAQDEIWWDDFIHDNRIPWSELKYSVKSKGRMDVSLEYAQKAWNERHASLELLRKANRHVVELIENLRDSGVTFSKIGEYYGATAGGVYNFLTDQKKEENPIDSTSQV